MCYYKTCGGNLNFRGNEQGIAEYTQTIWS